MQRKRGPQPEQDLKPQEFQPTDAVLSSVALLKEIAEQTQEPEYWSCINGAYLHGHCGCEDGTDMSKGGTPWGAGGRPGRPIYYSANRGDWHTPIRVNVENGKITGIHDTGK